MIKTNDLKQLFFVILSILCIGCVSKSEEDSTNFKYLKFSENILNYHITPKEKFDKSGLMFSDQGAWFAYSFPDSISNLTGFSGPFLMTQQNGVWSSASLSNLVIDNNVWTSHSSISYNSHLEQTFKSDHLELKQELVFSSGHTAIIKSTLKNNSQSDKKITYHFKNESLLADGLKLSTDKNKLVINSSKTDAIGHILFPNEIVLNSTDSTYTSNIISIELKPNETKEFIISQSFRVFLE